MHPAIKNRSRVSTAGFLWLSMVLLSGSTTGWAAAPVGPERVRLQLKWHHQFQFAGYYAALEQGFYRSAGLEVDIREAGEGIMPMSSVLKGESDFGVYGTELVRYRAAGVPVVALAAIFQHSPAVIACRTDRGIHRLRDIIGKRIDMEPDAADLLAMLKLNGIETNQFINPFAASAQDFTVDSLIQGTVDGMYVYLSDELFTINQSNVKCTIFSPRDAGIDFYGDILFTTQKTLSDKPAMVRAFREASLKGWGYALAHKAEIIQLILDRYSTRYSREHLQFQADQMQKLMEPEIVELGYMSPSRWQAITDTYRQLGLLNGKVDLHRFVYSPNAEVITIRYWRQILLAIVIAGAALLLSVRYFRLAQRLKSENQQRQASEAKLHAILETSPVAMAINDEHDNITFLNRRFIEIFGYTLEDIPTVAAWLQLAYPDPAYRERILPDWQAATAKAHREGTAMHLKDYRVTCKDGSVRDIQFSLAPLGSSHVVILYDLTERNQMEERLRQSRKMEDIGRLAGGIAHEFNNILAAMIMNLDFAETVTNGNEIREHLHQLQALCHRSADLVKQLLAFSRQSVMIIRPLDLAAAASEQCKMLGRFLGEAITIDFSSVKAPLWVNADQAKIEEVLLHLCLNARDAMKLSGVIRIRLTEVEVSAEQAKAHAVRSAGNFLCLSVADTGCGMDEKTIKHLFEPFFTTKDVGQGTGLGLAMVRGIIEQHHGWVEVESSVGRGSTFRVYLPEAVQPLTPPRSAQYEALPHGNDKQ
jgi:two-component system cell cycle sensor histidine kinase/response regulator CckA